MSRRGRSTNGWSSIFRFHLHFTPTRSTWLNLVVRWFAELASRKLRRSP
jgi:hypothetical protein